MDGKLFKYHNNQKYKLEKNSNIYSTYIFASLFLKNIFNRLNRNHPMNGVNCAINGATERMWCIHICTKKKGKELSSPSSGNGLTEH